MALDQEHLYMQYFYNAIIEYIYFIILYIEGFGNASLNTLCKHVKFFKAEVGIFILSFDGKTFEDKLYQMLNTLDYFTILHNKIYINGNKPFKDAILNDLVISKCVDLVLRGIDNIDVITENLNLNNVIFIRKENILNIIEKSSYFSTKNKQIVSLLNIHGLLGFEEEVANSVISYFSDLLYCNKVLSYKEVKDRHSGVLSFCGIHNVIMIISVLNSSKYFDCKNGYVHLKKKCRKHPKLKIIDLDSQETRFSSSSMTVGQIVQTVYGSSLYKWTGEIGSLNEYSGMIYCVVKFSNGSDGVFNVCFNEESLKIISDTKNLKLYLTIRDIVEFDAIYYIGKSSERCWRASRLKVLHTNKFEHDENLYDKLYTESALLKIQCSNNGCCMINSNSIGGNCVYDNCVKICEEKLVPKCMKTSDDRFLNTNDSVNKLDVAYKNDNKNCVLNQKPSYNLSFSNLSIINYSYMFGYIYMLMADKGYAIAEQGEKILNIVFMKNSVYTPDKFKNLKNGQKILALIPYCGTIDSFCVSTLVYGLNKKQKRKTERSNVLPKDFAAKIFTNNVTQKFQCKFCNKYDDLHKFVSKEGFTLKQEFELIKVYESILSEYKVPSQNDYLSQLLLHLYKKNSWEKLNKQIFYLLDSMIISFVKSCNKYSKLMGSKVSTECQKKRKRIKNSATNHNLQPEAQKKDLSTSIPQMNLRDELLNNFFNRLSAEYYVAKDPKSLDIVDQSSGETSTSFETIYSSDSNESYYSCESSFNSLNISSGSLIHQQDKPQDLDNKIKINLKPDQEKQLEIQPDKKISDVVSESNQKFRMKPRVKNLKQPENFKKTEIQPDKKISDNVSESNKKFRMKPRVKNLKQPENLKPDQENQLEIQPDKKISDDVSECNQKFKMKPRVKNLKQSENLKKTDEEKQLEIQPDKKISDVSESNQNFRMKPWVKNLNQRFQSKKRTKYCSLKANLSKKYAEKRKKKIVLPSILKSVCKNCIKSTVSFTACISMISTSFFFYTLNMNGCSVTLPLPKWLVAPDLQANMKLNTCSELTVIPNVLANLSHIIVVNTFA